MTTPLLPLHDKALTRAETADMLRGLAEFLESYPAAHFIVSLDIIPGAAASKSAASSPKRTRTKRA